MANPNPGNWAQVRSSFAQVRSSKLAESLSSLQLGSQQHYLGGSEKQLLTKTEIDAKLMMDI